MTVDDLGSRLSGRELTGWVAFEQEYGIPDGYFVVSQICRAVFAAFTGKAGEPGDFVPYFRRPPREQTPAEQRAIVRAHLAAARSRQGRV